MARQPVRRRLTQAKRRNVAPAAGSVGQAVGGVGQVGDRVTRAESVGQAAGRVRRAAGSTVQMDGSFAQAGASVTEGDGFARGQRGSGTVLAVGLVAAIASTLLALAAIGGAAVARLSAVAAADLAALAGAQALIDGQGIESACLAARVVAEASGAELLACRATAPDRLAATCQVPVELPLLGARVASAQAEAGPP